LDGYLNLPNGNAQSPAGHLPLRFPARRLVETAQVQAHCGELPLRFEASKFEASKGQTDPNVRFVSRGKPIHFHDP
jgi:hypothetical protein